MNRQITFETLSQYAYTNLSELRGTVRGVVVEFFGLGYTHMIDTPNEKSRWFSERDILYVFPYNDPWNWMNKKAVAYTDEVLDVLYTRLNLSDTTPLAIMGGSMGGLCALTYTAYASRVPKACVCNCPVCDLVAHYGERPDLPHTLYSAFGDYDCDMETALRSASPLHLLQEGCLPDIRYTIFHCDADHAVNIGLHSRRFVAAAEGKRSLEFITVPGRDHCDLGETYTPQYLEAVVRGLEADR